MHTTPALVRDLDACDQIVSWLVVGGSRVVFRRFAFKRPETKSTVCPKVSFIAPREDRRAGHRRGCHPKPSIAQNANTQKVFIETDALGNSSSPPRARLTSSGAMKATLAER